MIDFETLNATILRAMPEGPKIYTLKAYSWDYDPLAEYWVYFADYLHGTGWFCTLDKNGIPSDRRACMVKMTPTGAERVEGGWYVTFTHGYKGLYSKEEE